MMDSALPRDFVRAPSMNIVERLRGWAAITINQQHCECMYEAADTIEALAEALREIAGFNFANHPYEDYENQLGAAVGIARAALRRVEE